MKNRSSKLAAFAASLLFAVCGQALQASEPAAPALIKIDQDKVLSPVNALLFGNNLEAGDAQGIFGTSHSKNPLTGDGFWNPAKNALVPEVVELSKGLKVSMLRYPGGCLAHNFDWRMAVGDPAKRDYFKFGVDEYIELCRAVGAEPLIIVSEICAPQDASDFVEYLNLPATPERPWAMKRAAWGHAAPYGVKYFEMANESDHGNHDVKPSLKRSAEEYSNWLLSCAAAMRKTDPSIKIGGHAGTGTPVGDPWNATVLKLAGPAMDYFAVHTYVVGGQPVETSAPMRGCMAATDQIEFKLARYRDLIKAQTGKSLPLAVTEFNAGFVQEKPVPLRFSFGAAVFCADYLRVLLKPETQVAFANYWQYLNGYWGYVRTSTTDGRLQTSTLAAYPVFKLLADHVAGDLVDCAVSNEPKLDFEGFGSACPARGSVYEPSVELRSFVCPLSDSNRKGCSIKTSGEGSLEVRLDNFNGDLFVDFGRFDIVPSRVYAVSFEMKVERSAGSLNPGFGMADARGWDKTKSACGLEGSSSDEGWRTFKTPSMTAIAGAKAGDGVLRLVKGSAFSGSVLFKNIKILELQPEVFPAYAALTAFATRSKDGKKLELIVINKHHLSDIPTRVAVAGAASAKLWTVSAPDFAATAHDANGAFERVSGKAVEGVGPDGFAMVFPARSVNALEIDLK